MGSSPLARGLRLLPAGRIGTGMDHPRSRGVYCPSALSLGRGMGSSPLARGLLHHRAERPLRRRIIPARAGFTAAVSAAACVRSDHPRSRGVYGGVEAVVVADGGSSPLARGLPARVQEGCGRVGIIPARAGFTAASTWPGRSRTDHPRSRGVYRFDTRPAGAVVGSSPLARGLPAAASK